MLNSDVFLSILLEKKNSLGNIYHSLFNMINKKDLDIELNYLYTLYMGKDEYFKEYGIENWFAIFHKQIRQTDFYTSCFKETEVDVLSDDDFKKFKVLSWNVSQNGYDKYKEVSGYKVFNDEYRLFLDLKERVSRKKLNKSINGHLDSILWNTISIDNKHILFEALKDFFEFINHENNYTVN